MPCTKAMLQYTSMSSCTHTHRQAGLQQGNAGQFLWARQAAGRSPDTIRGPYKGLHVLGQDVPASGCFLCGSGSPGLL